MAEGIPPAPLARPASAWMGDGWNAVTQNFWTMVLLGLIQIAGASAIPIILQGPVSMGLQWATLRQVRGRKAELNDMGAGFERIGDAILISFFVTLILIMGFGLLIIPGIFLMAMLQFPMLRVLDARVDFWTAISDSLNGTRGRLGSLVALLFMQAGAVIAGALLCGVGLLIAIPWVYAATAAAYVDLFGLRAETEARVHEARA